MGYLLWPWEVARMYRFLNNGRFSRLETLFSAVRLTNAAYARARDDR